ncbi:hypothetical protein E4U58_003824 [Claviceps cyperi]|nr:hypothetical protein E4U58_003824 [Claviceps cyperi]
MPPKEPNVLVQPCEAMHDDDRGTGGDLRARGVISIKRAHEKAAAMEIQEHRGRSFSLAETER